MAGESLIEARCTATISRLGDRDGRQVRAEGRAAEARDQGDAGPGADEGQVAVELHRHVRDPGKPPGPVVHAQQPLPADAPLGGGDPVLAGQVAGGDDGAAGQRVVAADDHLGEVTRDRGPGEVARDGQGRSPRLCATPRSACPEATRLTASHGSRSVRLTRRPG